VSSAAVPRAWSASLAPDAADDWGAVGGPPGGGERRAPGARSAPL